jgi:hypothetical protein
MRVAPSLSLALLCSLIATVAVAQSDPRRDEAIKRYQEGVRLYDSGKSESAYVHFVEAYAVVQTPPILFNLARTEQLTGRYADAAKHFATYIALPPHPRVTPELRRQAAEFLAQVRTQLGHISVEAPKGTVVTVDDAPVEALDSIDVAPGVHRVAGKLGAASDVVTVTCVAGGTTPAKLVLNGSEPPIVPPVVVAPVVAPPVVPPVETIPVSQFWNGRRIGGAVITGVGVVGLVLGGVFAAERGSQLSSAHDTQAQLGSSGSACFKPTASSVSSECSSLSSQLGSYGSDAHLEEGFLIGGGALVAIGLVTMLWPSSGSATSTPSPSALRPVTGPHFAGLSWSTSF